MREKLSFFAHCRRTIPPRPNSVFNILAPIGLMLLFVGASAIAAFALTHPAAAGKVALANGPTFAVIKEAIDKQAYAFEQFKQVNDERLAAVKNGNEAKARELEAKLARIEPDISKWSEVLARVEDLEARASNPLRSASTKKQTEYKDAFVSWIRSKGASHMHEQKMQDMARNDVTIGSGAGGGVAVPEEISRQIEVLEQKFSPVRRLVKVVQVGTSDYKELINERGATSGWVGESGSRSATGTPQLREAVPTFGELYAYPQASEWSLDDVFFNVEQWLTEEVAQEFALQEGDAVIRGNGTSKPTGMLDTSPTSDEDFASPLRDKAAYQYIPCDNSPLGLDGDCLIDLVYKLNSAYRSGATWVMNSVTTGAVRKLKDENGQYLWAPGLAPGQPNMLLGFPLETWEQMDDVGTDKHPIAFGNFRRGYVLVDRTGLRITRDNITNIGFVRFYVRRREGGIVLNNDAIKFIKTV